LKCVKRFLCKIFSLLYLNMTSVSGIGIIVLFYNMLGVYNKFIAWSRLSERIFVLRIFSLIKIGNGRLQYYASIQYTNLLLTYPSTSLKDGLLVTAVELTLSSILFTSAKFHMYNRGTRPCPAGSLSEWNGLINVSSFMVCDSDRGLQES
jgi:hypothetical protein